jgi:hypothetical protein
VTRSPRWVVRGQRRPVQSRGVRRTEIPYFAQFASPELIGDFVRRRQRVEEDPNWSRSGARTREEYRLWAMAGCGMACLQMLLSALGRRVPSLVELGRECERYGGYRRRQDGGLDGLVYAGFVEFVTVEHGLTARVAAPLRMSELVDAAADDEVVLASVHYGIRTPEAEPPSRGGHLVLVVDADPAAGWVRFHNPSGDSVATQRHVLLGAGEFERFYAGRGIAVKVPRPSSDAG